MEALLNVGLIWLWSGGIALGDWTGESCKGGFDVTPMAAALTGALISGVGMYAIGTHAQDRFAMSPAMAGNPAMTYYTAAPQPVVQRTVAAPRRTVYRAASAAPAVYRNADVEPRRSITKTALDHRRVGRVGRRRRRDCRWQEGCTARRSNRRRRSFDIRGHSSLTEGTGRPHPSGPF